MLLSFTKDFFACVEKIFDIKIVDLHKNQE